ncbi:MULTISPECIES: hypothetical protein [Bacillus]|mgnify:CR=1 FL=1|jgi:hypothetical protein|uniref:DUF7878 domain-containing protein n=1 Tax=Bacillus paralicheniformis TaxID=1648923 RepID=A0ABY3FWT7_9BACI|nr:MULTISPECIES: hypothetical protein [Bacillus]ARC58772.1 hypothetical protein BaDB11_00103 [Bacillus licheniformis]ARC67882.1 hypothetical protein B34_00439 [Bacillus licheniformis]AYC51984.1 hypothetical protein C7M53_12045 [Bacillus licheniformis]EQM25344.1 hypothetical protein N399_24135 [Bacillus licheniformis CG-B52]KAA0813119.1 hypothetical protein EI978_08160 [Bacillus licheniformis]
MDGVSSQVEFVYKFTSEEADIPRKMKKDPSAAMRVEGEFKIKINGIVYFEENIALLEFYASLNEWIKKIKKKNKVVEYRYYTMEYEEDEPIISLIPFDNKARLTTIWETQQLYNVFDLNYIIEQMEMLHERLGRDIEHHYKISLKNFIGKIPLRKY